MPATPFTVAATVPAQQRLDAAQLTQLRESYEALRQVAGGATAGRLAPGLDAGFFCVVLGPEAGAVRVAPLAQYKALAATPGQTVWLGFADPCALPSHPGWPLRNLLVLAKAQLGLNDVTVLAYRENPGKGDMSRSIVLDVHLGDAPDLAGARRLAARQHRHGGVER